MKESKLDEIKKELESLSSNLSTSGVACGVGNPHTHRRA